MSFEHILFDVEDRVATITLNRPDKLNAWNGQLQIDISDALYECDANDDVRAVVVTGAGRAFCAGADISDGAGGFSPRREVKREAMWPYMIRKPVIAAINGAAVGVGITFPLLCDVRFVADDAKLGYVMTRRGILPELASHLMVAQVAGFTEAADLLLSGRMFSGSEAAQLGLVKAAVPKSDVLEVARSYAHDIAQNTAPVSVALAKKLLWDGLTDRIAHMMQREGKIIRWMSETPDAKEGVQAFFEKRAPDWKMSPTNDVPAELLE